MQSAHDKQLVQYAMRFAKQTGDGDDEKVDWTQVELDANADEYEINELERSARYQIQGRYQMLATSIWSRYSALLSFETLAAAPFEWDASKKGGAITLSNANKTAAVTSGSGWMAVRSKNLVKADQVSAVHWEVTLRQLPTGGSHKIWLMFGYIPEEMRDSFKPTDNLNCDQHYAFYPRGNDTRFDKFSRNGSPTYVNFDPKWNCKNCKVGDRMELRFDFQSKCCDLYYNGEKVGLLTDKLPNALYPAITLHSYAKPQSVETTKWVIHK